MIHQISQVCLHKTDCDALKAMNFLSRWSQKNGFASVDNTAVYKIPADRDIVAALSGHAVIEGNKNETEIGICKAESERQIIPEQDSLGACEIFSQYYDEHDSDKTLDTNLLFFEKYVQTRLPRSDKRKKDFF
jgi:hypothetical protein